jgi:hypothetical protein
LQDAGILRPLTDRKREQVWVASLILDESEDLSIRIGTGSGRPDRDRPLARYPDWWPTVMVGGLGRAQPAARPNGSAQQEAR